MSYPQHVVDEVRSQADIVRVVADYVALKKRGAAYIACCPFHQEKTPSFNVHPGKQLFKCFGCGVAGNVFSFVMNIEHVPFPEALKIVAQKCGIPLPEREFTPQAREAELERERLLELNEWACQFFEAQLTRPEGKIALDYLTERTISAETRGLLRLGFAPDRWDALSGYLKSRGATVGEIEKSGLVTVKESGNGHYDRFRGRLIFPIIDTQGRIVAFGGRILGDGEPKYLNSPETVVYTKGNFLYGLSLAREHVRRTGFAVVVEGYFDFALPFQEGIRNVVATLGTALTENQVRLIRRFMDSPRVIINFDPDQAGQAATRRSIEIFLEQGFKVNVLLLPYTDVKYDPDTYVRTFGGAAYRTQLKSSQQFIEYLIDQGSLEFDTSRPIGKVNVINRVLPYLGRIQEPIERAIYTELFADRLKIDDRLLRDELKKAASGQQTTIATTQRRIEQQASLKPVERRLISSLLAMPELCDWGMQRLAGTQISTTPMGEKFLRAVREAHQRSLAIDYDALRAILTQFQREERSPDTSTELPFFDPEAPSITEDPASLLDEQVESLLAELFLETETPTDEESFQKTFEILENSVLALERQYLEQALAQLQSQIERSSRAGDHEQAAHFAMQKLELTRQLEKFRRFT
ncbi:MAG: DNA primase [Acidobacteria bacterium]|nr:DNA primase [Acidobacteriota bacterium]